MFPVLNRTKVIDLINDPKIRKYHEYYFPMVRFTANQVDDVKGEAVISIAHMVYSLMPTILRNVELDKFQCSSSDIFSEIRAVRTLKDVETYLCKIGETPPINNSWVGTSKFLHFVNPEFFPIWDSRVAKHQKLKYKYQIEKMENILDYIHSIYSNLESDCVDVIQKEIKNNFGYTPSKVRAAELSLFMTA
jgi:hypothetical protein